MAMMKKIYSKKICIECNSKFNTFNELEFNSETKCSKCKRPKFKCPICENTSYKAVFRPMTEHTIIGGSSCATHYKCDGCSVLFENVELFSVHEG